MSGGVEVKSYFEKLEQLSSEELDRSARSERWRASSLPTSALTTSSVSSLTAPVRRGGKRKGCRCS